MNPSSLIVSTPQDVHAAAIFWAAKSIGANVTLLDSTGFLPGNSSGIEISKSSLLDLGVEGVSRNCNVWMRKGTSAKSVNVSDEDKNHAISEWSDYERGFLGLMEMDNRCSWVNKLSSIIYIENKIVQLNEACREGLATPKTIVTTNYDLASSFVRKFGSVVIKPFVPHVWISEEGNTRNYMFARKISSNEFAKYTRHSITQIPIFYQECIDKVADIRVAIIGDETFSIKMTYDKRLGIDHREFQDDPDFNYEPYVIDGETECLLRSFMKRFELRVVSADFLLDRDGKLYFIDLNPCGAFLFIEKYLPTYKVLRAAVRELVKNQGISTNDVPGWQDFCGTKELSAAIDYGKLVLSKRIPTRGITYV